MTNSYYSDEDSTLVAGHTIAVVGANGFIGRAVCKFIEDNHGTVERITRPLWDMLKRAEIEPRTRLKTAQFAINVAGVNGSVAFNREYPATVFHENLTMGLNLMKVMSRYDTPLLTLLSSCGYPEDRSEAPLQSDWYLEGHPNVGASAQGYAKRGLLLASNFYNVQCKTNFRTCVIPTAYGPGDSFNEKKSKVVGGMINKLQMAKGQGLKAVDMWGNPETLREFIYVADAAKLIVRLAIRQTRNGEVAEPVNLGSGQEVTMEELANMIMKTLRYKPKLNWLGTNTGQKRKLLDNTKTQELFPHMKFTDFYEGIQETCKSWQSP